MGLILFIYFVYLFILFIFLLQRERGGYTLINIKRDCYGEELQFSRGKVELGRGVGGQEFFTGKEDGDDAL